MAKPWIMAISQREGEFPPLTLIAPTRSTDMECAVQQGHQWMRKLQPQAEEKVREEQKKGSDIEKDEIDDRRIGNGISVSV